MIDKDVDLEGITFRSEYEKHQFVAGQRERAIAQRAKDRIVKQEASDKARLLLYGAAKTRERARLGLQKTAKSSR